MTINQRTRLTLARYFEKHLYLPYILGALILQLVSLFKQYPYNHPCGRVFTLKNNLSVLINCDSAVFMRDAQDPLRLFNGISVYQDRPLPTLTASILSKIWHEFNFPDYYRSIIGNSGISTTYSLATYAFFLLINVAILATACLLSLKIIVGQFKANNINIKLYPYVAGVIISVVALNEITKTFFWTPHSQMFNILLPVYMFYLLQFSKKNVSTKFYLFNSFIFLMLLFSYAFFILLAFSLALMNWKTLRIRIFLITTILFGYLSYPFILSTLGGNFYSIGIERYRLFIWIFDSLNERSGSPSIINNIHLFLETLPVIPIILISFLFVYYIRKKNSSFYQIFLFLKIELLQLHVYALLLAGYGYYARRLSYPLIIFLSLILIKLFLSNSKIWSRALFSFVAWLICYFILISWVTTSGPLV
jgi:hypothetical protein